MQIAVDVRSLMEGRHSGGEEYTTHILRSMATYAPQHIFQAYYNSARKVDLPEFPRNVHPVPYRYPNKVFNAAQLVSGYPRWDSLVRGDVFFVPNARLTPLSVSVPLVTVAHDVSYELFPEFLNPWRRVWHQLVRPRQLMRRANHIIAVSEHTKEDLMRLYDVSSEKVSVIYSGLSLDPKGARSTAVQQVRQRYHLPEHFVLYVGRFEPRKNITGIIEAFGAIADRVPHDLVLAGESGWKQGEHQAAYLRSAYRDRIHPLGFIPEAEKAALYAAADLFVYPSFYEGFGFPPLEALSVGTPVITSFNSSLPEVVGKWATLVDPYDTSLLAAVMHEVLQSPVRVPYAIREEVRSTYNWQRAAKQTVRILESMVRSSA
ncbi:MAG: glycosyltransferase family 1 protein [Candidatus Andersenbacteria bacterium]